jgi:hypothetical protein
MLYRQQKPRRAAHNLLLFLYCLFDRRERRRRQVEQDLMTLSPHLKRDLGYPWW